LRFPESAEGDDQSGDIVLRDGPLIDEHNSGVISSLISPRAEKCWNGSQIKRDQRPLLLGGLGEDRFVGGTEEMAVVPIVD
jgi:hypothetical protein